MTDGLEVFVHDVIAAMTTWPWSSSNVSPSSVTSTRRASARRSRRRRRRPARGPARAGRRSCAGRPLAGGSRGRERLGDRLVVAVGEPSSASSPSSSASAARKPSLASLQRDAVLRALGPGQRRHDVAEVQLDDVGERRLLGVLVVPEALLLGVGLDEVDELLRAAGERQVAQRLGVDREDRAGRAELRAHVADRRAVGQRQRATTPGPKNSTNLPTTPFLRSISVTVSTRSVAVAPSGSSPCELEADDLRDEHRHRLAEHRRLGLDAADAPAQHAEAVDHRRVRVGADERVGVGLAGPVVDEHDARQVLEVDLVDDARCPAGRP